jgi:sec-independent protein translocase protein TatB
MLDLGLSKLAVIGALALVVIGPEKLPRVARTVGTLLGKAQRYMNEVKAEVNRSIALDDLRQAQAELQTGVAELEKTLTTTAAEMRQAFAGDAAADSPNAPPAYQHPGKNWRIKRGARPTWYKAQTGARRYVQSGSARVARFRPKNYR